MMHLQRAITPDEVAAYRLSGVVLLRGVLDLRAVETMRSQIDEAVATLEQSAAGYDLTAITRAAETGDRTTLEARNGGQYDVTGLVDYIQASGQPLLLAACEAQGRFLLDTGVTARHAGFRDACLAGALPEIAGALLGAETVRFLNDQIFVKQARTREKTAYHQDAPYFEVEGEQCCSMWVPADPVTVESGGMRYVRGSHRGRIYAPNLFVSAARMPGAEGELLPDIEAHPERYDLVQFDVEPGDIVVHHYKTIHGAGGNLSQTRARRAASIRYCGDDVRFWKRPGVPRQLHHHGPRLQDGEPLSGPDYPVVWQRSNTAAAA